MSIKVAIRIKPPSSLKSSPSSITINKHTQTHVFNFDRVFGAQAKQADVFEFVRDGVRRALEGVNMTVFCYGHTGAGKTYTMVGSEKEPGLVYRVVEMVLNSGSKGVCEGGVSVGGEVGVQGSTHSTHSTGSTHTTPYTSPYTSPYTPSPTLTLSCMELYNEKLYDLLNKQELSLREDNKSIVIQHLSTQPVPSTAAFKTLLSQALSSRATGPTALNNCSSRSHAILRLNLPCSKITLIDLAGSEDNRKTGNTGVRMAESACINKSLFVLGKVVGAILAGEKRVPYRDSKLTRMLMDCVGGKCEGYLVGNVGGDGVDAFNTLVFASKSRSIKKVDGGGESVRNEEWGTCIRGIYVRSDGNSRGKGDGKGKGRGDGSKGRSDSRGDSENIKCKGKGENIKCKGKGENIKCKGISGKGISGKGIKCKGINTISGSTITALTGKNLKDTSNCNDNTQSSSPTHPRKKKKVLSDKTNLIPLSPLTKQKSFLAFLKRAQQYDHQGETSKALKDYKTLLTFSRDEGVLKRIKELSRKKDVLKLSRGELLQVLNSADFVRLKKLRGVGDRRAECIVGFVNGGNVFREVEELRVLFGEKVVCGILENLEE